MHRHPNSRRRRRGFTLIEVLLVMAILLILAGLAVVAIGRTLTGAQAKQAKIDISTLTQAINVYYLDVGTYPNTLVDLVAIPDGVDPQKWNGSYLEKDLPKDPWGRDYEYTIDGDRIAIRSAGKDGTPGTQDDVTN